ncbi:MAG: DegV family protein [Bacilli bacterium]
MLKNSDFVLFTDSCCDLSQQYVDEYDIKVVSLSFRFADGKEYVDTTGHKDLSMPDFYKLLETGGMPKTSAINANDFEKVAKPYLDQGKDILVIAFSSALSATYNSFRLAAEDLNNEYKNNKVYVVDSKSASGGQGMLVYLTAKQKAAGKTIEECYKYAEDTKLKICHYFTVDDLSAFLRSGRLTASAALLGTLLKLKPVMHMDDEGRLVPIAKKIGHKASMIALAKHFDEECIDDTILGMTHGSMLNDVDYLKGLMLKNHPNNKEFMMNYVGPVIGSHTGSTVIAIYFLANHR